MEILPTTGRGASVAVAASRQVPHYDVAFYDDDFITDPFEHYAAMRRLGPVVYLPQLGNFAVTRYDEVREALRRFEVFSSASGVAADDAGCAFMSGAFVNTLNSDPPTHDMMRGAVAAPLLPGALDAIRPRIRQAARDLVDALLARGEFDGMADLARHLPMTIVTELVGLPEQGRGNMLQWAAAAFDVLGIQNERRRHGLDTSKSMRAYVSTEGLSGTLKPGGWTARLYEFADRGEIPRTIVPMLFRDYIAPSLDTTISATGHLFHLLARNAAQWDRIRRDSSLIPGAVNEAMRLGSPIRSFARVLARDHVLGGVTLPVGARVTMLYASANRDERRFPDPDRFDPGRPGSQHVGFGHGIHQCVGMHLAWLEMESLLEAMVPGVAGFDVGEPTMALNNTIHGFATMPMRLMPGGPVPMVREQVSRSAVPAASPWREMRVVDRRVQVEDIVSFDLEAADGAALPVFTAGAHVDVEVAPGLVRQYSLCNAPSASTRRYRIAVLRERESRGGSRAIHEAWWTGHTVRIGAPRDTFRLREDGRRVILVAGGVGITPMLSMAYRLHEIGRDFVLHHRVRTPARAAFRAEIERSGFASRVHHHFSTGAADRFFSVADAIGLPQPGTDIYCCGPSGLMDRVVAEATALGWSADHLHLERFGPSMRGDDAPFTLVAHRSGLTLHVPPDRTMLDVLTEAGVEVASSCCAGVCSTCLTDVLCGVPDHRDIVLTPDERSGNERVAVCCSRSLSDTIVLDI